MDEFKGLVDGVGVFVDDPEGILPNELEGVGELLLVGELDGVGAITCSTGELVPSSLINKLVIGIPEA